MIDLIANSQSANRDRTAGGGIMSIGSVMSQNSRRANRRPPIGRTAAAAGRNAARGTPSQARSFPAAMLRQGERAVNGVKDSNCAPPAVISAPPERDLERKLKRNPGDPDA